MSMIPRYLLKEAKNMNTNIFYWAFPLTVGFTWFIWDALDEEWLVSLKLAPDPEALNKRVETARLARLEALKKPKPTILKGAAVKDASVELEEEEQEEDEDGTPADDKADPPSEGDEEEVPAEEESDDDVPAGEDGDDAAEEEEEADEEEEEETEVVIKPLYDPVKGKKLGKKDIWDNFTIRALNMGEDDDDDDDEEEEEEEEGTFISHFSS